ncbi:gas vesicle protein [Amycolatopsis pigmentata]|uniref:Gas vesicle protein n=1 Tax=Amycolatopsis pigmentata TaxID=450801 RepID=A0ABW5FQZ8_9PSEU
MDNNSSSLADVLERVLDKGVVIVGEIAVSVVDVELLTLRLRLFVASAQTAREMGMDWWSDNPYFTPHAGQPAELRHRTEELRQRNTELLERVSDLEKALEERR